VLIFAALSSATSSAVAQEPINATDSATSPSPGHFILKHQFRWSSLSLDAGPRDRRGDIDDYSLFTTVNMGLTRDLSMSVRFPLTARDQSFTFGLNGRDREQGIGDVSFLAKYRIYQNDVNALDTQRLSLIAGAQIRTGDSPFTGDGYNPIAGIAFTQISGRHGFNAALQTTFTTGGIRDPIRAGQSDADLIRYDAAYLYRISPAEYSAGTHGALYGVIELNGYYETNGDHELFIAPGIMYEAAKWTAELSIPLPAWQAIDDRAETDFTVVAGVRFSF
jgi:hypothetical protein